MDECPLTFTFSGDSEAGDPELMFSMDLSTANTKHKFKRKIRCSTVLVGMS